MLRFYYIDGSSPDVSPLLLCLLRLLIRTIALIRSLLRYACLRAIRARAEASCAMHARGYAIYGFDCCRRHYYILYDADTADMLLIC